MELSDLQALFDQLAERNFDIVGPAEEDGAIIYRRIRAAAELPVGLTQTTGPGRYRLRARADAQRFGHIVGPVAWRRFLRPPEQILYRVDAATLGFEAEPAPNKPMAFVGVRACDLAALAVLDRVLLEGKVRDERYAARRAQALIIAVGCSEPAQTCFCTSTGTGPSYAPSGEGAAGGWDLALTELCPGPDGRHVFVVEVGSDRGAALVEALELEEVSQAALEAVEEQRRCAEQAISRELPAQLAADALSEAEHWPGWGDVARRCLSCSSCTMVCPTCFCTTVEDRASVDGATSQRVQVWDSCFGNDFSSMHGQPVRSSIAARYRQWLTHKLSSWHEQFGESGCVGCGRCIAWCPAGIDLTEEVHRLLGA